MDKLGAASTTVELLPARHPRTGRSATFYRLRVRRNDPWGLAGLLKGLLRFAPWRQDFEAELPRFPAGVHDDQVDAFGLIGQMLDRIRPGHIVKPAPKPSGGMAGLSLYGHRHRRLVADAADQGWRRYTNTRTNASAEYPAALVAGGPIEPIRDGRTGSAERPPSGIRFSAEDGLEIGIFGVESYDNSPLEYMCSSGCGSITYKVNRPNLAIISGRRAQFIYYKKCTRPSGTQALHCFDLDYPAAAQSMAPIIERTGRSLR